MSIIALLRSPLRRPPGEWIFRAFWLGGLGARLLRRAARKVGGASGGRTTNVQVTSSVRAEVPNVIASARARFDVAMTDAGHASQSASATNGARNGTSTSTDLRSLVARVEALERWRSQYS